MQARVPTRPGSRRAWLGAGVAVALAAAATLGLAQVAGAATAFSADFEDGSINGWSKSGGTWAVGTDGSRVVSQSKTDSENARLLNGPTDLTDATVQARVKPASLASGGFVGLLTRVSGSTTFYRLALVPGRVELQAVRGGAVTVLGSTSRTVATGTWYTLAVTTTGTTVTGTVDGVRVATATSGVSAAGRIGLQTGNAAASFDDVLVTTGGTTTPTPTATSASTSPRPSTSPPSTSPSTSVPPGGNAAGLAGFATLTGYGRAGTSGGAGGPTVTVSTYAQLASAVADDAPRIVRVSGTITGAGTDMLDVGSNKTIIGAGGTATISGFGLDVNGWGPDEVAWGGDLCDPAEQNQFTHVQNVIIRNLTFRDSPDDSVNVQCYSHHVWVDHNTFYRAGDGSVDIKRGSDLATVSYNRFIGTDKSMLLGHSDSNGAQDLGYLHVTYHHNWFDGSNTRHPRVRFGYAHLYANYVDVTDYFIGLGVGGQVYAESNTVVRAKTITQDFGDTRLTWTGSNVYDVATITRANDSGKTIEDWLRADGTVARPTYSYTAGTAPTGPPAAGAGVGGADTLP